MHGLPSAALEFTRLFAAHRDALHRYCLRRLGSHDANEATSEVFLVAWGRMGEVPPVEEALPWLYGVAKNVVRNSQRSLRRRTRLTIRAGAVHGVPPEEPEPQNIGILNIGRSLPPSAG